MDSLTLILIIGAAAAGFVQGLSGFAFGLVAMSFWAWTVPPQLAAVMAVFGALVGQTLAAVTVRRGFNIALLWPFLAGGLVGVPIGVWLLPMLDVQVFKACLGLLLVTWCPVMLMTAHLPPVKFGGRWMDAVAGWCGGLMGGIGGFAGAIPTLWCTLRRMPKDTQRAVIQNFNLAILIVAFAMQIGTGLVTRDMLPYFAWVAPAMLIPTLLGARLYIGISEATFRKIVLGLLTASGVALLASSVPALLSR